MDIQQENNLLDLPLHVSEKQNVSSSFVTFLFKCFTDIISLQVLHVLTDLHRFITTKARLS